MNDFPNEDDLIRRGDAIKAARQANNGPEAIELLVGLPPSKPTPQVVRELRAVIASLETGADVQASGEWWRASGVHPAPGKTVIVRLPITLTVTGRAA